MILDVHSTMRTVFSIFAVAWISVILILFIATGLLTKKAERLRQKHSGH